MFHKKRENVDLTAFSRFVYTPKLAFGNVIQFYSAYVINLCHVKNA